MSDWSEGEYGWTSGSDLPSGSDPATVEDAIAELGKNPSFVVEGTGSAGSTTGTGTLATDPSLLTRASKALGISEQDLLRMGLGGVTGAVLGKILSNQPQGAKARGIQSFTRDSNVASPTGAIGTGAGGGGVSYFNSPKNPAPEFKFDPGYYLAANPDVNQYVQANLGQFGGDANRGALAHYTKFGIGERRRPSASGAAAPMGGWGSTSGISSIPLGERYTGNYSPQPAPVRPQVPIGGWTYTGRERPIPVGQMPPESVAPETPIFPRNPLLERPPVNGLGEPDDFYYAAPTMPNRLYAAGGQTPSGLGYLRSAEDGMADRIPATIDNRQPAKLSGGEFVIPADVVSHLGNGNSDAGAKQLHDFMARIRKARTGNQAQGKRIDPAKFFPKGRG